MYRIMVAVMLLCVSAAGSAQKKITVAQDGMADYKTVQAALDAVPVGNTKPVTIFVKKGTYKELIVVDAKKPFITLVGEDRNSTILTYNNHKGGVLANGDSVDTRTSASFFEYADDFHAENISFENNAGFTAGQAVALRVDGNRASFKNCSMLGFQDVLLLNSKGKENYFEDCYIEGTTDFIFGSAVAVFKDCHIHSKKNSHITAASTDSSSAYGFVFFNCRLTADSSIDKVSLGRPWRPYSSVTYINCWMDKHIIPVGWDNWKKEANEKTARYAEYNSTGPGANVVARAKWSRQLTKEEAEKITIKNIFSDWNVDRASAKKQ